MSTDTKITVQFPADLAPLLREEATACLGSAANCIDVITGQHATLPPAEALEVQRHVEEVEVYADILYRFGWDDQSESLTVLLAPPEAIARIVDAAIENLVLNHGKSGPAALRATLRTVEQLEVVREQALLPDAATA